MRWLRLLLLLLVLVPLAPPAIEDALDDEINARGRRQARSSGGGRIVLDWVGLAFWLGGQGVE